MSSITIKRVQDTLDKAVIEVHSQLGQDTVIIAPSGLLEVARLLKEDPELEYNYLMDLTAVDYWKRRPRFEVVYHFLSLKNNFRIRVKVPVPEPDPKVDSLTSLWSAANWYEREGAHSRNPSAEGCLADLDQPACPTESPWRFRGSVSRRSRVGPARSVPSSG